MVKTAHLRPCRQEPLRVLWPSSTTGTLSTASFQLYDPLYWWRPLIYEGESCVRLRTTVKALWETAAVHFGSEYEAEKTLFSSQFCKIASYSHISHLRFPSNPLKLPFAQIHRPPTCYKQPVYPFQGRFSCMLLSYTKAVVG